MSALDTASTIIQLIIAIAVIGFVFVVLTFKPLANKFLEQQIRRDCAQAFQREYSDPNTNTTVRSPIEDEYQKCLEEAGI